MPSTIHESCRALEAVSETGQHGRIKVTLITPGIGSSGYYSQQVLENAGKDRVFKKGTHVFFDHPSETEQFDRPERSVRDLAGVFAEDAYWDGAGLVAEAHVIGAYRDLITDPVFVDAVGMSIRATAETRAGEVDGKKTTIITRLDEGISVDLVTRAGRGGRIAAVLESARTRVGEAMTNDTREALDVALRAAYGADQNYVWVRDFDPAAGRVWFTVEDPDSSTTYEQGYALADDGTAVLADGDPIEVRARTEYVPVTAATESGTNDVPAPAGQSTATESEGDDMATTQIEESRLAQLEKDSERVQSLESDLAAANERAEKLERDGALLRTREAARPAITRTVAESGLPARRQARIVESIVAGVHQDTAPEAVVEATKKAIADEQADIAELAESLGIGTVRGFGQSVAESSGYSVEDFDAAFSTSQEG